MGTVVLIQRYLFKLCDGSTMEDYLCHRDKMILDGREIQTVDDILDAFKGTIRERRSMMRIRSDYMTQHLHHTKEPIYGNRGQNLNLAVKHLTAKYHSCDFENMRSIDILLYTLVYAIQHEALKEKCFELWTQRKKDNLELEVDDLVDLM